jgi:excisionase family DNA binding protein
MKLTVREAAERAGVCAGVVYGWLKARSVPFYRVGGPGRRGKYLIEDSDLEAFLARCRVEAKGPESVPAPKRTVRLLDLRVRPS